MSHHDPCVCLQTLLVYSAPLPSSALGAGCTAVTGIDSFGNTRVKYVIFTLSAGKPTLSFWELAPGCVGSPDAIVSGYSGSGAGSCATFQLFGVQLVQ